MILISVDLRKEEIKIYYSALQCWWKFSTPPHPPKKKSAEFINSEPLFILKMYGVSHLIQPLPPFAEFKTLTSTFSCQAVTKRDLKFAAHVITKKLIKYKKKSTVLTIPFDSLKKKIKRWTCWSVVLSASGIVWTFRRHIYLNSFSMYFSVFDKKSIWQIFIEQMLYFKNYSKEYSDFWKIMY